MSDKSQLVKLRAKKLGLLIYDVRLSSEKTIKECATLMGVTESEYLSYESGSKQPSLPEIESFAFHLDIPLEHFWGSSSLSEVDHDSKTGVSNQLRKIRNRVISTKIKLERTQNGISLAQLSELTTISKNKLRDYEEGKREIPLPELEVIVESLGLRIEAFIDSHGPVGAWRMKQKLSHDFSDLPVELQQFVCKPVNRPFLELSMRLSELSVDKLRTIAENLLEITY